MVVYESQMRAMGEFKDLVAVAYKQTVVTHRSDYATFILVNKKDLKNVSCH